MDPEAALVQLTKVSKHIEAAVLFDEEGTPVAATVEADRAGLIAELASRMLAEIDEVEGDGPVIQVEAATGEGSVFLVREADMAIAATTPPAPIVGLVMYDLRTCLRSLAPEREPA
jgi:predicted regulator of Ras-like GTPase activity (Roadblock/LC7/MglB family)